MSTTFKKWVNNVITDAYMRTQLSKILFNWHVCCLKKKLFKSLSFIYCIYRAYCNSIVYYVSEYILSDLRLFIRLNKYEIASVIKRRYENWCFKPFHCLNLEVADWLQTLSLSNQGVKIKSAQSYLVFRSQTWQKEQADIDSRYNHWIDSELCNSFMYWLYIQISQSLKYIYIISHV